MLEESIEGWLCTRVHQVNKCIEDNGIQVSHWWQKRYKYKKDKIRKNPLVLDWN